MKLSAAEQEQLALFPPRLRRLVEAELAVGNHIVEIGHSHPAPPAGTYFKLAQKVSTQPRRSGDGLTFYERNHSIYSGEFTDDRRFFFVLEPPNPSPEVPDMNAIRQSLEPKPASFPVSAKANNPSLPGSHAGLNQGSLDSKRSPRPAPPSQPLTSHQSKRVPKKARITLADGVHCRTYTLEFRDARLPHEVQFGLERELRTLFTTVLENHRLRSMASLLKGGARYVFTLEFIAASSAENHYRFQAEVSWPPTSESNEDYHRRTSAGWIDLWTESFTPAVPLESDSSLTELYQARCAVALEAENHLDSVTAIQQVILSELKRGSRFTFSDKEGTTNILWRFDRFVRDRDGDSPAVTTYANEAEFLEMLRRECQLDTFLQTGIDSLSDFQAWKLVLRRMRSSPSA